MGVTVQERPNFSVSCFTTDRISVSRDFNFAGHRAAASTVTSVVNNSGNFSEPRVTRDQAQLKAGSLKTSLQHTRVVAG